MSGSCSNPAHGLVYCQCDPLFMQRETGEAGAEKTADYDDRVSVTDDFLLCYPYLFILLLFDGDAADVTAGKRRQIRMKNKTFIKILAGIVVAGILSTTALTIYTIHLRQHCSIITYIANE